MRQISGLCALVFVLSTLIQLSYQGNGNPPPLPPQVINEMASRNARLHHFLWHNIRNLWNKLDAESQQKIRDMHWDPPRPATAYVDGKSVNLEDNDSGEDFFYMHREMIKRVNKIIKEVGGGYKKIRGFRTIPTPWCKKYRIPAAYDAGNPFLTNMLTKMKADDLYHTQIKPLEDQFYDPEFLRSVTLGQLGSKVETTIHNWLHMRYSEASPLGFRGNSPDVMPVIDTKWDNPAYDWLGDTYSSHVSPWFWLVHGWVDCRINAWKRANGVKKIVWKGTWEGGPMYLLPEELGVEGSGARLLADHSGHEGHGGHGSGEVPEGAINVLEEVVKVLKGCGLESQFYDSLEDLFGEEEMEH